MTSVPVACSSSWSFFGASANSIQSAEVRCAAVGLGLGVGVAGGLGWALSTPKSAPRRKWLTEEDWSLWEGNVSRFASMSIPGPVEEVVEPTTGMTFPGTLEEGRLFTGAGLRKKSIFGLKKINVYTFGVYVDPASLKAELGDQYSNNSSSNSSINSNGSVAVTPESLGEDESFFQAVMEREVSLTVRLVIVYGSLKIGSVRSAFEDSVGSRIKKFGGAENRELLHSFTGAFTDDIQLPKGTTIDLTRLPGNILTTKIDGTQVGRVESALICRSLFDLYIGDDPFDKDAKKAIGRTMASFLGSQ